METGDIDVFIGVDVGKAEHWATALDSAGKTLFDKALPNNESRLRDLYKQLAEHGRVLVVVDQPATIGALAVAVAQDMGVTVGYLPGLSMRRIADLSPGNAKTDARHAAVIAQAAATLPHTLRDVTTTDEQAAALTMLTGFDLDLARQVNQTANRIRGLYTQIHPALETVLGPRLEHDAILETIATWPTPAALKKAGKTRIAAKLNKHGARAHTTWAQQICDALAEQTVTVAGTDAAGAVLNHLARQLASLRDQRAEIAAQVEALVEAHPLYPVLTTRARDRGPGRRRLPGRNSRQDLHRQRPTGLIRRPSTRHQEVWDLDQGRARLPRRKQKTQESHVPVRLRLSALRRYLQGLLPAQTRPRQTPGPNRHRASPPPHPHPARHDPKRHPLQPPTNSTGTHRRLTHHTGAPPGESHPPPTHPE